MCKKENCFVGISINNTKHRLVTIVVFDEKKQYLFKYNFGRDLNDALRYIDKAPILTGIKYYCDYMNSFFDVFTEKFSQKYSIETIFVLDQAAILKDPLINPHIGRSTLFLYGALIKTLFNHIDYNKINLITIEKLSIELLNDFRKYQLNLKEQVKEKLGIFTSSDYEAISVMLAIKGYCDYKEKYEI